MKRIVIKEPYVVEIENSNIPDIGDKDLLVKAEFSGISQGTELAFYRGEHLNLNPDSTKGWTYEGGYPLYPGYEFAGIVIKRGKEVKNFETGNRVVGYGPHAKYAKIGSFNAVKIPDHVSFQDATLSILGATAMHAVLRSNIEYGESVVVIGMGVLGMLILQHARLAGAGNIIAVDLIPTRLSMAKTLGADYCVNPSKCGGEKEIQQKIHQLTDQGCDTVIEVTGNLEVVPLCLRLAKKRGKIVIVGFHTKPVSIHLGEFFHFKELTLIASRAWGPSPYLFSPYIKWTSDKNLQYTMNLISEGKLRVGDLVTHTFKYTDIFDVYKQMDQGNTADWLQIVLDWREETTGSQYKFSLPDQSS